MEPSSTINSKCCRNRYWKNRRRGICTVCGRRQAMAACTRCQICRRHKLRPTMRARTLVIARNSKRKVTDEVFQAYGGYRCKCCGETERLFLSIDHINNNGAQHRRELGIYSGTQFHYWLRRNKFPPGFQVLCANCQIGKYKNKGICPHQAAKQ
jgi:hypothetical protein